MNKIKSILVCDDHELYRSGLVRYVVDYFGEHPNVLEASDGLDALSIYNESNPDLVFLDIEMPGKNGIEVCKEIKSKNKDTLIIVVTMHTEKIVYSAVRNAKANGYLTKGASKEEVEKCITNVLKNPASFYTSAMDLFSSEEEYYAYERLIEQLNILTNSEKKVLQLVLEAKSSEEIAEMIFVSKKSVNNYRNHICRKLELPSTNNSLNRWATENNSALKVFFS